MKVYILRTLSVITFTLISFVLFTAPADLQAQAPTHVPRFSPVIDYNINGFWEYLPRNYTVDVSQKYPLLIFLHGYGESGSTPDSITLRTVLNNGTPKIISNGTFPDSFFVAGKWFKFIVISPQIKNGLFELTSTILPSTVDAVIEYAKVSYRVDTSRIYLGGLSMGGGAVWDYAGSSVAAARKIAGITIAAGAADLTQQEALTIANANLPVIATHNTVDDVILASRTVRNVELINSVIPPVSPSPKAVYWNTPGPGNYKHDVWTRTYELLGAGTTPGGNLTDTLGVSVYEWMLQNSRSQNVLPVIWKSFTADETNRIVSLKWETAREQNIKSYEVEKSRDGRIWNLFATIAARTGTDSVKIYTVKDSDPYPGITYYRIKQVDQDNRYSYSIIEKITQAGSAASSIRVYPSPFVNRITIGFTSQQPGSVHVIMLNSGGATVKQWSFGRTGNNETLTLPNLRGLQEGVYYIRITDSKGKILATEKVFK